MPKLKLFHGLDPLESDAIPFPRLQHDRRFQLRLTGSEDAISRAEAALDDAEKRLDDALALVNADFWFDDDDGPRAA